MVVISTPTILLWVGEEVGAGSNIKSQSEAPSAPMGVSFVDTVMNIVWVTGDASEGRGHSMGYT